MGYRTAIRRPAGPQTLNVETAQPAVAVLIPCYNEAAAIAEVVARFKAALPQAGIVVYDNNSTDGTAAKAREAGAAVSSEPMQGK